MEKSLIFGISGGIAAYKIADVIKELKTYKIPIKIILTKGAKAFVSKRELENLSGNKVHTDLFEDSIQVEKILSQRKVEHIDLAGEAGLIVIAPATANIIAKLANGIADDYITTTVLASTCDIVICPSMNVFMWTNPATQANIQTLINRGYSILGPDQGMLACGYTGKGRLVETNVLVKEIINLFKRKATLKGKKIVVTAGGTREYIDDVRFISNSSSGKMGVAFAEAAFLQGADVVLLRSKTAVHSRYNIVEKEFETSEELLQLLKKEIPTSNMCIHSAAVGDFTLPKVVGKISSNDSFDLRVFPAKKIIQEIKKINPAVKLIGFKATWALSEEKMLQEGQKLLTNAGADVVVINDVSKKNQGFESDSNEVIVITKEGKVKKILVTSKRVIARKILDFIST